MDLGYYIRDTIHVWSIHYFQHSGTAANRKHVKTQRIFFSWLSEKRKERTAPVKIAKKAVWGSEIAKLNTDSTKTSYFLAFFPADKYLLAKIIHNFHIFFIPYLLWNTRFFL